MERLHSLQQSIQELKRNDHSPERHDAIIRQVNKCIGLSPKRVTAGIPDDQLNLG